MSLDLSQASLEAALGDRGTPFRFLESTGSTNSDGLGWAATGAPDGAVVVAEHQTHGRGRWGRSWTSEPGRLLQFSVVLRLGMPADRAGLLTTAVGLAAAEGIELVTGITTGLKWPNDVTVGGLKVAGVLVESQMTGGSIDAAVAGIGINVGWTRAEIPAEIADRATSLSIHNGGAPIDRPTLLLAILDRLVEHRRGLEGGEAVGIVERASTRSIVLGLRVRARFADGRTLDGTAVRLTDTGALEVDVEGERRVLDVGEIEQLR